VLDGQLATIDEWLNTRITPSTTEREAADA
jgi:hypothetical protein